MKNEKEKPTVFCGVLNMDGSPAKMTEDEVARFMKMCSNNGENKVIFCRDNSIPKALETIATSGKREN